MLLVVVECFMRIELSRNTYSVATHLKKEGILLEGRT
jgi:hypothetical protein